MTDLIQTSTDKGVLTIRMNRPEKKNAITLDMYRTITTTLQAAADDDAVRVILIGGVPGAFSAGNDIKDFLTLAEGGLQRTEIHDFLTAIACGTKPMIAAVDGLAIGIGTTLLMHCDLTYASSRSVFRTPFIDLGLTPEAGSSLIGPRIMGDQRAFALLALGETFDAEAAREAGFVYKVVEYDVEAVALEAAQRLAQKPPRAVAIARQLLRGDRKDVVERIELEIEHFSERLTSDEARAAFTAFMAR
ncbi:crotonase/enoyl-CoA hydratase family protein [Aurantimonas sp. A2-1-M11]|uniref:crotonase/enoyl-CoA hydratase family protein n=1 Tax=Aurantimonas sp. A2-1-M11 TaxID=3113712 RepID=UPI002F92947C